MALISNPIVALLIVIGILVTVHEFGHFIVGRLSGVAVEQFSIGFGPALLHKKIGVTTYRIGILPFGGYVKFYGMLPSEKVPDDIVGKKFFEASYPQKVATLAAGPLANLLLAIVVYSALVSFGIPHPQAIVGEIQEGSSAEKAGLQFQDQVTAVNGEKIRTWMEMRDIITKSAGKQVTLTILRNNEIKQISLIPDETDGEDLLGRKQKVGRAGIARGAVPAIVAVDNLKSPAGAAGLRTGMRILSVDVAGKPIEVLYWQEFLRLITAAVSQKQPELVLVAAPTHKDGVADRAKEFSARIKLRGLSCGDCLPSSGKQLANAIGISDAQLVIADWQQVGDQGLQKDDRLLTWNGKPIDSLQGFMETMQDNKSPVAKIAVRRDEKLLNLDVKLKSVERQLPSGKEEIFILPVSTLGLPVEPEPWIEQYKNPFQALWFGTKEALNQSYMIAKVVGLLFVGQLPLKALGGPIMIANAAGDAAQAGLQAFAGTLAIISINLAVFNAIPLPLFDGGQIVLATVEFLRRRRLSEGAMENFQRVGFAILMALIVLATHNDVTRYWAAMVKSLTGSVE